MRRLIPPTPVMVVAALFVMAALAAPAVSIGGFIVGGVRPDRLRHARQATTSRM
jgi:hypothetical protein